MSQFSVVSNPFTHRFISRRPPRLRQPPCRNVSCVDIQPRPTQESSPSLISLDFDPSKSALCDGIKSIAIGKHGTKAIPEDLIPLIAEELLLAETCAEDQIPHALLVQRASFLGSLFVKKHINPAEMSLLKMVRHKATDKFKRGRERTVDHVTVSAGEVVAYISPHDGILENYAYTLLNGLRLSILQSAHLGRLLFACGMKTQPMKSLIAHVMRVRHESEYELAGLSIATSESLSGDFSDALGYVPRRDGRYVHVAEPFDGTATWDLITPLLCRHLKMEYGLRPILSVGESSGPKYGPNLRDVTQRLGIPFAKSAEEVASVSRNGECEYGVVVDQADCSDGLHEWVSLRRAIIKRPAIATAEKFVDAAPGGSTIYIGSAFHPPYIEKMAFVAEVLGYPAYIIAGKGMEGSLGFGHRGGNLLIGWRREDGSFKREVMELDRQSGPGREPAKGSVDAGVTCGRIERFVREGTSGDDMFDWRVAITLEAFDKALTVLKREVPHVVS